MLVLILALVGIPVGLALDAIVERLSDWDGDEGEDDVPAPSRRRMHAEAGSLVVEEAPARTWARRVLIVGTTVALFAAAGARYDQPGHLALITAYVCVLVSCAATDLICYRVPNVITYPAIAGAIVVGAAMPDTSILSVLKGGALAALVLFLPALITGGVGIGMGDVKLALFAGLALGFGNVILAMLVMALTGGAVAAVLMIARLRGKGEPIAYAPFISLGALVALLAQGAAFVDLG
jgi:leader peptidase (prepilin peptidase)/N-methyltransferase